MPTSTRHAPDKFKGNNYVDCCMHFNSNVKSQNYTTIP